MDDLVEKNGKAGEPRVEERKDTGASVGGSKVEERKEGGRASVYTGC